MQLILKYSVPKLFVLQPTAQLEFHSVGTGLLMILGVTSQRYLSISDAGLLRGSVSNIVLFAEPSKDL